MHIANTPKQIASDLSSKSPPLPRPASNRRSLLAMAAAGIACVSTLATAASAQLEPDAELIELCNRFVSLERRVIELFNRPEHERETDAYQDQMAAVEDEEGPTIEAICRLRCTTPEGAQALARAVVMADSALVSATSESCYGQRLCHTVLISLLGVDGIECDGDVFSVAWRSAVPEEDPICTLPLSTSRSADEVMATEEPDAELIQACRELDAVVAQRTALYDYENRSISDKAEKAVEAAGDRLSITYCDIRNTMEEMSCSTLKGLGAFARSILKADMADLSLRASHGDVEYALIVKALEQAATYA